MWVKPEGVRGHGDHYSCRGNRKHTKLSDSRFAAQVSGNFMQSHAGFVAVGWQKGMKQSCPSATAQMWRPLHNHKLEKLNASS